MIQKTVTMGGECFRYVRCTQTPTADVQERYGEVYRRIVNFIESLRSDTKLALPTDIRIECTQDGVTIRSPTDNRYGAWGLSMMYTMLLLQLKGQ